MLETLPCILGGRGPSSTLLVALIVVLSSHLHSTDLALGFLRLWTSPVLYQAKPRHVGNRLETARRGTVAQNTPRYDEHESL